MASLYFECGAGLKIFASQRQEKDLARRDDDLSHLLVIVLILSFVSKKSLEKAFRESAQGNSFEKVLQYSKPKNRSAKVTRKCSEIVNRIGATKKSSTVPFH